jgi:hypothetical protein
MAHQKRKRSTCPMTKSPVQLARTALACAQEVLEPYSCPKSRHDFTQAQLFAILVLKAFFRTDYRGIVELLEDFSDLRRELRLSKVPHASTLCYAEQRLLKKGLLTYSKGFSLFELSDVEYSAPQGWAMAS